jgi:hypothetical protein
MARDEQLKKDWDNVVALLSHKFDSEEALTLDAVMYLIGVQELGQGIRKFQKDDKVNLMHIAICRILEPYGYYLFDFFDEDGWPHYKVIEELPHLKPGEQAILMKEAIVGYFKEQEMI